MAKLKTTLEAALFSPIKAFRLRYLPLLMIYFAYGASTFTGIAESFFVKERLGLDTIALLSLAVWLTLPWTVKMVLGQLVDSVKIFGSTRRAYIFIAAAFLATGSLLMAGLAGRWAMVVNLASDKTLYIAASLVTVIGTVLQDVVADAMSIEVVEREGRSEADIRRDLAMVQLLGRLALSVALFSVAGLGGWLTQIYSDETIFLLALIIPILSISGCLFIKLGKSPPKPIHWTILGGGILYGSVVTLMGLFDFPHHQVVIFFLSLGVVLFLLSRCLEHLAAHEIQMMASALLIVFVFRAMPSVGPGLQWWQIDVLGFDKAFFGTLAQIGAGLSILGMWFFAKPMTEKPIAVIFTFLTLISFSLSLPILGLYHGLHEWTQLHLGFGARTIALLDTALLSPFAQMSMVPMLVFIARYAPRGNNATWFALMSSLMNLALTGSSLLSRTLNHIWVVHREIKDAAGHIITAADYSQLGALLWCVTGVGLIVPLIFVFVLYRKHFN